LYTRFFEELRSAFFADLIIGICSQECSK
jgi:hypothetical protein